jgi:hypothetical protein
MSGNALEHGLHNLIVEVRANKTVEKQFNLFYNLYLCRFPEFKNNWQSELENFCSFFNISFQINNNQDLIVFKVIDDYV